MLYTIGYIFYLLAVLVGVELVFDIVQLIKERRSKNHAKFKKIT